MGSEKCDALIIDGRHSLYRATDAHQMLSTNIDGVDTPVGGVYGFLNILIRTQAIYGGRVLVAWEGKRNDNFRLRLYPEYKKRNEALTDDKAEFISEMSLQETILKEFLRAMGIAQYSAIDGEADDVIARLSLHFSARDKRVYIYSGDSDLRQLVDDPTESAPGWIRTVSHNKGNSRGGDTVYDKAAVKAKHDVWPHQIPDLKALAGDSSDNIPGAPGIGPVVAAKLLNKYTTIRGVITAAAFADDWPVAERFKAIVHDNRRALLVYKRLTDLNVEVGMTAIRPEKSQRTLVELLTRFRFRSLMHAAELQALMRMG